MQYYSQKRIWDINNSNYGKPIGDEYDCVDLSISDIENASFQSLIRCIDFYLPKRNIKTKSVLTKEEQITLDEVKSILKSSTSNEVYDSTIPDSAEVSGCTDPNSLNYNKYATVDNGTCIYAEEAEIKGCTDPNSLNYNPNATTDDGSCTYNENTVTKKYYVWSTDTNIKWKKNGVADTINGVMYDSFSITHDVGSIKWSEDVREVPKLKESTVNTSYYLLQNIGTSNDDEKKQINESDPVKSIGTVSISYRNATGALTKSSNISPGSSTTICAQEGSIVGWPGVTITKQGVCGGTNNNNDIIIDGGIVLDNNDYNYFDNDNNDIITITADKTIKEK